MQNNENKMLVRFVDNKDKYLGAIHVEQYAEFIEFLQLMRDDPNIEAYLDYKECSEWSNIDKESYSFPTRIKDFAITLHTDVLPSVDVWVDIN